jgi:hypothetical protein
VKTSPQSGKIKIKSVREERSCRGSEPHLQRSCVGALGDGERAGRAPLWWAVARGVVMVLKYVCGGAGDAEGVPVARGLLLCGCAIPPARRARFVLLTERGRERMCRVEKCEECAGLTWRLGGCTENLRKAQPMTSGVSGRAHIRYQGEGERVFCLRLAV